MPGTGALTWPGGSQEASLRAGCLNGDHVQNAKAIENLRN